MKASSKHNHIRQAIAITISAALISTMALSGSTILSAPDAAYAKTASSSTTTQSTKTLSVSEARASLNAAIAKAAQAESARYKASNALLRAKNTRDQKEAYRSTMEKVQAELAAQLTTFIKNAAKNARTDADTATKKANEAKAKYDALLATLPTSTLSAEELASIYDERVPLQRTLDQATSDKKICEYVIELCEQEIAGYAGDASKTEKIASCQATIDQAKKDIAELNVTITNTKAALANTDEYDSEVRCEMAKRDYEKAKALADREEGIATYLEGLDIETVTQNGQVIDCGRHNYQTLKEESTLNKRYVAELAKANQELAAAKKDVTNAEIALTAAENAFAKAKAAQEDAQKAYNDAVASEKKKTSILGAIVPKKTFTYTGKVMTSKLVVKVGTKTLKNGRDYTLTKVTNCKKVGSHKVKIKGIGSYKGYKIVSFKIVAKK